MGSSPPAPGAMQTVVVHQPKNVGIAVALSFVFGPLGMLYATIPGALVMFIVNMMVALITVGFGLLLTWPIGVIWAAAAAKAYNRTLPHA